MLNPPLQRPPTVGSQGVRPCYKGNTYDLFFKIISLFVPLRASNHGGAHCVFCMVGKPSMNRGALRWFHNVWTYDMRVIEYGTI